MSIDLSSITERANIQNPTKRHVVSVTSAIFDPIGILSPVTIRFKILLQQLHHAKMEWDEEIQGELLELWIHVITCIRDRQPIIVPRCYFELMSDVD